jgi:hypothetical protein
MTLSFLIPSEYHNLKIELLYFNYISLFLNCLEDTFFFPSLFYKSNRNSKKEIPQR